MSNGFPEGDFRIINEGTGARLFARSGGVTGGKQKVSAVGRDGLVEGEVAYSHTNDPIVMVGTPQGGDLGLWYFRAAADPWGRPDNYLMTSYEDIRSKFALHAVQETIKVAKQITMRQSELDADEYRFQALLRGEPLSNIEIPPFTGKVDELVTVTAFDSVDTKRIEFRGSGRDGVSKWQTEGGYLFLEGAPEQVLTVSKEGDGSFSARLMKKDGSANQKFRFERKTA